MRHSPPRSPPRKSTADFRETLQLLDLRKELLEARTQLSNLMPYMDGKSGAEDLIGKILKLCEEQNLELEQSNSKLRRMSKKALSELLAEKLEVGITTAIRAATPA